jgi:glycosyltransferase involved in cell wall biosynthesis
VGGLSAIDRVLAENILSAISTAQEAAHEINAACLSGNGNAAARVGADLSELLSVIERHGKEFARARRGIKLGWAAESAADSLTRLLEIAKSDTARAQHKLEFELFPILQAMYGEFYFFALIFPDKEKMLAYFDDERRSLFSNHYIDESIKSGKYKYDLSITVAAYNKLEYTKLCVSSLLENLPSEASYELILVNHGSSDGTKEYFESIKPDKQLDIKVNASALSAGTRILEGEFYMGISNDTIITPHAIDNMLRIMRECPDVGYIVPSTPNISNLQDIPAEYSNWDELKLWAEANNRYDPFRHEVRTRLCNPISFLRNSAFAGSNGIGYNGRWFTGGDAMVFSFPDDELSMLTRRAGLKNILAKDAYCYHFGQVTIKDDVKKNKLDLARGYENGRREFRNIFGIDPWGTGTCYLPDLVPLLECTFDGHIDILGVNCGIGSNSLKLKELYKELNHNLDVSLCNITTDENVIEDLTGISDCARVVSGITEFFESENALIFHHIVWDDSFEEEKEKFNQLDLMLSRLRNGGSLYFCFSSAATKNLLSSRYPSAVFSNTWVRMGKI